MSRPMEQLLTAPSICPGQPPRQLRYGIRWLGRCSAISEYVQGDYHVVVDGIILPPPAEYLLLDVSGVKFDIVRD
jgi:hypothetical protein